MGKILHNSIIENVPFWILGGISIVIGVTAFIIPPTGQIDPSVLKFISWMFAYSALWTVFVAMMRGIDATISHGSTSVSLNNPNDEDDATAGLADEEELTDEEDLTEE